MKENTGQAGLKEKVLDAHLCTGCGACVALCPYQATYNDQTVILHPCDLMTGRCYAFCPRTPTDLETLRRMLCNREEWTVEIGPVKGFFIARAADANIRRCAQHGGTVSALIALALTEGLIDTAIVSEGAGNFLKRGVMVKNHGEIKKKGKSTFIVSATIAEFNRAASGDAEKIGIVATPCQSFALAKMRLTPQETNNNADDKLRLTLGLFCGWTLSWRKLRDLLRQRMDLSAVTGMDIPPGKQAIDIYTADGAISLSLDEIGPAMRESCRYCIDTTAEWSDIAVGSARLPEPWEVKRSWNQVIVRTERGQQLLDLARMRGVLEFKEVPAGNLVELKRAALKKKREAIEKLIEKSGSASDLIYLDREDPVISRLL